MEKKGTLANSFHEVTIPLMPKPGEDITRKDTTDQYPSWHRFKNPY